MFAIFLSVLFIYLIHSIEGNINQRKYRKISDVECESNSSFIVGSNVECAFQCLEDEECAYFKMDMTADGFHGCSVCTQCRRYMAGFVSTWFVAIQTSTLLTGKSRCLKNDTSVYLTLYYVILHFYITLCYFWLCVMPCHDMTQNTMVPNAMSYHAIP